MRRILLAPTVALALVATPVTAMAQSRQQGLDQLVSDGATGVSIEVRNGHRIRYDTAGVAVRGTNIPVPAHGKFRIGSVTKSFLATVVLQLVAEHRIGLDDSVEKWLPGTVPNGADITVAELLAHTDGLYNLVDALDPPSGLIPIRWRTWTPAELVRLGTDRPPVSAPGEYRYGDTGYVLLGMIVERATGNSYATEIDQRIIRPLHLSDTSLPDTDPRIPGRHAHGYIPDTDGNLIDFTAMNPSVLGAAGEIISSARDLDRFFAALLGGRLLPPDQLRLMTDHPAGEAQFGLKRLDLSCGSVYGHDGDVPGFSTWSFSTGDRRREATVSLTWGTETTHRPVQDLLDQALCD